MRFFYYKPIVLLALSLLACQSEDPNPQQYPEVPQWSEIEIDVTGPQASEDGEVNPFTDYRLDLTFSQGDKKMVIPAFFAADGNAAETSASTGNIWRVRFRPPTAGIWEYQGQLISGKGVVYGSEPEAVIQQISGGILATSPAKKEKGRLLADQHPRYLQWSHSREYFFKGGANSPENLLAYAGFDSTYRYESASRDGESKTTQEFLHQYAPHRSDWQNGNTNWQNGKGKGLVGALNYLAATGCNSIYFLTMNIQGDGKDVWPYTSHEERLRFDVSKLAQWEKVFDHADDSLGLMLHFVLGETENESLLDGGELGPERQLYYREMLARFGHHRAVTWDLGEEIGENDWSESPLSTQQIAAAAQWFDRNDPYQNYTVIHTHSVLKDQRRIYSDLVGHEAIDGLALQVHLPEESGKYTQFWLDTTTTAGRPWKISVDEIGPWWRGLDPDERADINNQDSVRALVLWANLMNGGMGAEWYFGAFQPQQDLNTENWRAYDRAWHWTGKTLRLFRQLDAAQLEPHHDLVDQGAYCLTDLTENTVVYLPFGQSTTLDLNGFSGTYELTWHKPDAPESSQPETQTVTAPTTFTLQPPGPGDWAAIIR